MRHRARPFGIFDGLIAEDTMRHHPRRIEIAAVVAAGIALAVPALPQEINDVNLLLNFNPYPHPNNRYTGIWGYVSPSGQELALLGVNPHGPALPNATGLLVVDVTSPTSTPVPSTLLQLSVAAQQMEVRTYQHYAYFVHESSVIGTEGGGDGLTIVDLGTWPPTIIGRLTTAFSIAHSLVIADGKLYVMGSLLWNGTAYVETGTRIFDLSDPRQPVEVGYIPGPEAVGGFFIHDAVVRNGRMYAAAYFARKIFVIDVSNPSSPSVLTSFSWPAAWPHNCDLTPDGNYLLVTDEQIDLSDFYPDGNIHIFDVRDLNQIRQVSTATADPNLPVHNLYVSGTLAHVAYYYDGYRLFDISNIEAPVEIAAYDTYLNPQSPSGGEFKGAWGAFPYTASGNVLVSDIQSGLWVFRHAPSTGAVAGTVTDAATGASIPGATVNILSGGSTTTNSSGFYKLYGGPGPRTVIVGAFGYLAAQMPVTLTAGSTVPLSFSLIRAANAPLAGVVRNGATMAPVPLVTVRIVGTPLSTVTNANGQYSFPNVPNAFYQLRSELVGYAPDQQFVTVNGSPVTVNPFLWPAAIVETFETGPCGNPLACWTTNPDGSDNATAGAWVWGDPVPNAVGLAQPADDHTPGPGVASWMTGNSTDSSAAFASQDVDGNPLHADAGKTTLQSPVFDLSSLVNPHVSFWRWYFNGETPSTDVLSVQISRGGGPWEVLETVPASSGWTNTDVQVTNPSPQTRFRFVAQDGNPQDDEYAAVEALIDDFMIYSECPGLGSVVPGSMQAWSEEGGFDWMELHFRFSTTQRACGFEVRYRVAGTTPWSTAACGLPGENCLFFNPDGSYEALAQYTPCQATTFEWQARMQGCAGWSAWSPSKNSKLYCVSPGPPKPPGELERAETAESVPVRFRASAVGATGGEIRLAFEIPREGHLTAHIFDLAGRTVGTLIDAHATPGRREIVWSGRSHGGSLAPTGIYFFRAQFEGESMGGKVLITR